MKKNYIALAIGVIFCLNLMVINVNAVTVIKPIVKVTSVKLSKTKEALIVNKTDTLKTTITPLNATNKAVTWKSSNIKVANVDKLGKVTAVSAGTATITVTTVDGSKRSTCIVTVTKPATTTKPSSGVAGKDQQSNLDWLVKNVGMTRVGNGVFYNPNSRTIWGAFLRVGNESGANDVQLLLKAWIDETPAKTKGVLKFYFPTKYETIYSMISQGYAGNGDKYLGKT